MTKTIENEYNRLKLKLKEILEMKKKLWRQEKIHKYKYNRLKIDRMMLEKKLATLRKYDSPQINIQVHKSNIEDLDLIE